MIRTTWRDTYRGALARLRFRSSPSHSSFPSRFSPPPTSPADARSATGGEQIGYSGSLSPIRHRAPSRSFLRQRQSQHVPGRRSLLQRRLHRHQCRDGEHRSRLYLERPRNSFACWLDTYHGRVGRIRSPRHVGRHDHGRPARRRESRRISAGYGTGRSARFRCRRHELAIWRSDVPAIHHGVLSEHVRHLDVRPVPRCVHHWRADDQRPANGRRHQLQLGLFEGQLRPRGDR